MRCDANISIRPIGAKTLGTKVELKNLNSISYVRAGIDHEIKRQIAVVEAGGVIVQETRDYDGLTGASQSLRSKEMAHDYRYFPDPDLMPVVVDEAWQQRLRADCPELPFDRQRRYFDAFNLPYTITSVLVWDAALAAYFEAAVKLAGVPRAQAVGNWIINDLLRELKAAGIALAEAKVRPEHLAALVAMVESGELLNHAAKEVFAVMFTSGEMPAAVAERLVLKTQPTNTDELEQWCREAIEGNAKATAEFRAGKDSAINALKGPVMKASRGKASPQSVDQTLRRLLAAG